MQKTIYLSILLCLICLSSLAVFAETIQINYQIKRKDSSSLTISVLLKIDKTGRVLIRMPNPGNIFSLSKGVTSVAIGQEGEFRFSAEAGKTIILTYTLTNGDGPAIHPYYSRPVVRYDSFYISGNNGLAMPIINDSAKMVVKLAYIGFTESKFLGSSYFVAKERGGFTTSLALLKQSIFCGGNYKIRQFDTAGRKVVLALAGKIKTTDDKAFFSVKEQLLRKTGNHEANQLPFYFSIIMPYQRKIDYSKSAGLIYSSFTLMEGKESAVALIE